jgi:predicted MFS family arabinose efflux permease
MSFRAWAFEMSTASSMSSAGQVESTKARLARDDFRALVSTCVLGICGYGFASALPVMLGTAAEVFAFSEQQQGWLGSAELFGMLAGSLLTAVVLRPVRHRKIAAFAVLMMAVGIVGALLSSGFASFLAARICGGFGGGVAYSVSVACICFTRFPVRGFGILSAALVLNGAAEMAAIPWVASHCGLFGAFGILSIECIAAALLLRMLPTSSHGGATDADVASTSAHARIARWCGAAFLLAVAIYHTSPIIFWAYADQLGAYSGLTAGQIGVSLTATTLIGAVACLVASKIGMRWSQQLALIVSGLLLVVVMASWTVLSSNRAAFPVKSTLVFCLWEFATVFQLGIANCLDRTGRLATLVPAAQGIGQSVGPLAGATMLGWGIGLGRVVELSTIFIFVSLAIQVVVYYSVRRSSPELVEV